MKSIMSTKKELFCEPCESTALLAIREQQQEQLDVFNSRQNHVTEVKVKEPSGQNAPFGRTRYTGGI